MDWLSPKLRFIVWEKVRTLSENPGLMAAIEVLIISRGIERIALVLCAPLLLYWGYRLLARALADDGQARADLRDKYRFQVASFLPGAACILLAMVVSFGVFSHPLGLSKAEEDLLIKLDQMDHSVPQSSAPALPPAGPGAVGPGDKIRPASKPS